MFIYEMTIDLSHTCMTQDQAEAFVKSNAIYDWADKAFSDTGADYFTTASAAGYGRCVISVMVQSKMAHRLDWVERDFAIAMPIAIKQFLQETK